MDFKRNILITGGAGFIGSHVVRLFVTKYPEYHIINLDKLTYAGNLANLADIEQQPNYTFVKADICDFEKILELFRQHSIDGVIHLAAESHVDRSIKDPFTFAQTNVMGTLSLLQAAKVSWDGQYDGKRFYHISTDEVYGAPQRTFHHPDQITGLYIFIGHFHRFLREIQQKTEVLHLLIRNHSSPRLSLQPQKSHHPFRLQHLHLLLTAYPHKNQPRNHRHHHPRLPVRPLPQHRLYRQKTLHTQLLQPVTHLLLRTRGGEDGVPMNRFRFLPIYCHTSFHSIPDNLRSSPDPATPDYPDTISPFSLYPPRTVKKVPSPIHFSVSSNR